MHIYYKYVTILLLLYVEVMMCNVTYKLSTMIDPAIGGTISSSGSYYLDWDVTGPITIAASNVTLNINNHVVNGTVVINPSLQNIAVKNGTVNSSSDIDGITVHAGCNSIAISDIVIQNARNGITIEGTSLLPVIDIVILNAIVKNCSSHGYKLQDCNCNITRCHAIANGAGLLGGAGFFISGTNPIVTLDTSNARANSLQGIFLTASEGQLLCINVHSMNNFSTGFYNDNNAGLGSSTLVCENCYALSNGGDGFFSQGNFVAFQSVAQSNAQLGFNLVGGLLSNVEVSDCIAQLNGTSSTDGGFHVTASSGAINGLISNCISLSNVGIGFNYVSSSTNNVYFIINYSYNNQNLNYAVNSNIVNGDRDNGPFYWYYWQSSDITDWYNVDGQ